MQEVDSMDLKDMGLQTTDKKEEDDQKQDFGEENIDELLGVQPSKKEQRSRNEGRHHPIAKYPGKKFT